ncbi:MAG: acyltransferase [Vampirovibrio sp.]|nr:acyltransferase [Vampirovibrio sp.]
MPSTHSVKIGLVQLASKTPADAPCSQHRQTMIEAHLPYVEQATQQGVNILCFQEIFTGPYFPPSQDPKWYDLAERIPEGETVQQFQALAKQYGMVMLLPLYEEEMAGLYYNTVAVIDADGTYLGKYRKNHLPQVAGFWEKFFFRPGNLGYPVFKTKFGTIGVYICYDRHFPEGARALGLAGAEIVFNPSATVAGLSESLWQKEQVGHAIANGYFVAAINRVGTEAPWNIGQFYGTSYIVNPYGDVIAKAPREGDFMLVADVDMQQVREARNLWQFYRDRRPETYQPLIQP